MSELIKQIGRREFSGNDAKIIGYLCTKKTHKKTNKWDPYFIGKSIKNNQRSKMKGKSILVLEDNIEFEIRNISLTKYKTYLFLP